MVSSPKHAGMLARRHQRRRPGRCRRLERTRRRDNCSAAGVYVVAMRALQVGHRRLDEVTLAGTPVMRFSDQTATASGASFSMGKPTELPHSLHDPS
jgi:hypothetical protein